MYIYYDEKTDYLEAVEKKVTNYSVPLDHGIFRIHSEKGKKPIGYGIEGVSHRLDELNVFNPFVKLSIMIKIFRIRHHYTQQQIAEKMKIGLLPYQRLESGENNPTLKTLLKVKEVLPDLDFFGTQSGDQRKSKLLKASEHQFDSVEMAEGEPQVRTPLFLEASLIRAYKKEAAKSGVKYQELMHDVLKKALHRNGE